MLQFYSFIDGIAAQVINSRLAMLGFVAAIGAEVATHKGLLQQFSIAPLSIAATFMVFSGYSLHIWRIINHQSPE